MNDQSPETTAIARPTWLVWLLATCLAGLAWCAIVLGFGTLHPLQVTSGRSMLPTLRTGDLVLIHGVAPFDLRVGEIVAVRVPRSDQRQFSVPAEIVHRIVGLSVQDGTLVVQTQGDSQGPDPFTVPASAVDGTMVGFVPGIGYGVLYLHSRPGLIALAGLAVLGLLYVVLSWGAEVVTQATEPSPGLGSETAALALAVREYGEHLQSHTRVVKELGGTTEHLRTAAATQNDILRELHQVVGTLAGGASPPPLPQPGLVAASPLGDNGAPGGSSPFGPLTVISGVTDRALGPNCGVAGQLYRARPTSASRLYATLHSEHRPAMIRPQDPERLPSRRQRRRPATSRSVPALRQDGWVPDAPLPSRRARKRRGLRHA